MVTLVVGSTGLVGSQVTASLAENGQTVRALVRPGSRTPPLGWGGVEAAVGDLRDPVSVRRALRGATTVVSAATALSRYMAGDHSLRICDVDLNGMLGLVAAADAAGVERFVYVSIGRRYESTDCAAVAACRDVEDRLRSSSMNVVVVRPEPYAELWLSPRVGFDPAAGSARIFGRGQKPVRFTSTTDVGTAVALLASSDAPPAEVELAAPEAMSVSAACDVVESIIGRRIHRRHIPRAFLRAGSWALRRLRPEVASAMAFGLALDTVDGVADESGFTALGLQPRPVSSYLRETYGRLGATGSVHASDAEVPAR